MAFLISAQNMQNKNKTTQMNETICEFLLLEGRAGVQIPVFIFGFVLDDSFTELFVRNKSFSLTMRKETISDDFRPLFSCLKNRKWILNELFSTFHHVRFACDFFTFFSSTAKIDEKTY